MPEPEQPRPPLHDAHGRDHGTRIAGADTGRETIVNLVQPSRFEIAQPFCLLAIERIQPPELLLDVRLVKRPAGFEPVDTNRRTRRRRIANA